MDLQNCGFWILFWLWLSQPATEKRLQATGSYHLQTSLSHHIASSDQSREKAMNTRLGHEFMTFRKVMETWLWSLEFLTLSWILDTKAMHSWLFNYNFEIQRQRESSTDPDESWLIWKLIFGLIFPNLHFVFCLYIFNPSDKLRFHIVQVG